MKVLEIQSIWVLELLKIMLGGVTERDSEPLFRIFKESEVVVKGL